MYHLMADTRHELLFIRYLHYWQRSFSCTVQENTTYTMSAMDIIDESTQIAPIVSNIQSSSGLSISVYAMYVYVCLQC